MYKQTYIHTCLYMSINIICMLVFFFFKKKNTTKKLCVRHTSPSGATKLHPNAVQELNEVKQIN
jgi:hypothetical protein